MKCSEKLGTRRPPHKKEQKQHKRTTTKLHVPSDWDKQILRWLETDILSIFPATESCNCQDFLRQPWHRGRWYICIWWCKMRHISPSGPFCFLICCLNSICRYLLVFFSRSFYAHFAIVLCIWWKYILWNPWSI